MDSPIFFQTNQAEYMFKTVTLIHIFLFHYEQCAFSIKETKLPVVGHHNKFL